jgi:hypothetical protein
MNGLRKNEQNFLIDRCVLTSKLEECFYLQAFFIWLKHVNRKNLNMNKKNTAF